MRQNAPAVVGSAADTAAQAEVPLLEANLKPRAKMTENTKMPVTTCRIAASTPTVARMPRRLTPSERSTWNSLRRDSQLLMVVWMTPMRHIR